MAKNIKVITTTDKGSLNIIKTDRVYIDNKHVGNIKTVVRK